MVFRSICTIFSLREKIFSLERTKKNEFSFGSLLTYLYLCKVKDKYERLPNTNNYGKTITFFRVAPVRRSKHAGLVHC